MSTRSIIALVDDTGVHAIYCHWDGYIECNGRILHKHYNDRVHVAALLVQGDMSELHETVEKCKFYHRDRGEPRDQTRARTYKDVQEMLEEEYKDSDREFVYIFLKNDIWAVIDKRTQETEGAVKLSDKIAQLNRQKFHVVFHAE